MTRKALTVALAAIALLGAGCAVQDSTATIDTGNGTRFIPTVVDWSNNVGVDPAALLDGEGNPMIVYLGFPSVLKEGEIPENRQRFQPAQVDIPPPVPNVMWAYTQKGYWNIGAVDWIREPGGEPTGDPKLIIPPATDKDQAQPIPNASTDAATDAQGTVHAVWTDDDSVQYASNAGGDFQGQTVASGLAPEGASIAVSPSGTPTIGYYDRGAVWSATIDVHGHWTTQLIDKVSICAECHNARTSMAEAGSDGAVLAYTDGRSPVVATNLNIENESPVRTVVQPNGGGWGAKLVIADGGSAHVAYYQSEGTVQYAVAPAPDAHYAVTEVAKGSDTAGQPFGWSTGLGIGDSGKGYITWYDLPSDSVKLASIDGTKISGVDVNSTQGGTSPSLQVSADGTKVYVAWYDRINQNLAAGTLSALKNIPIAIPSPSPVVETVAPPAPAAACDPTILKLTAPPGASASGFDPTCLAAVAGKDFKIAFSNQETSIPHNVFVFADSAYTKEIAHSETITGPATATVDVPAQKPGTYYFQCEIHPTTMMGTLVVK